MDVFSSEVVEQAKSSRLLVTVALHYRANRLIHLAEMVRTLSDFPVKALTMMILTNTSDDQELETLRAIVTPYNVGGKLFSITSVAGLSEPFALCWAHRRLVKELFCVQQSEFSHFVYFEDDMRFSYQNFCYFLYGRAQLKSAGLLPSFVRVEFNERTSRFYSTDAWERSDFNQRPHIDDGQTIFVPLDNVYCAIYVLDHELAYEFVNTRSFDQKESIDVSCWGIAERGAAGLCFENTPARYLSRYVVPVAKASRCPDVCSWIYHLPNTFVNNENPGNPYGKFEVGQLFRD